MIRASNDQDNSNDESACWHVDTAWSQAKAKLFEREEVRPPPMDEQQGYATIPSGSVARRAMYTCVTICQEGRMVLPSFIYSLSIENNCHLVGHKELTDGKVAHGMCDDEGERTQHNTIELAT